MTGEQKKNSHGRKGNQNMPRTVRTKKPQIAGVMCGIGSMLLAAKQVGFKVLGNEDPRSYFHSRDSEGRNTFKENFREEFQRKIGGTEPGVDVVVGHPKCGDYSKMFAPSVGKHGEDRERNPSLRKGQIPQFLSEIARIQPRFFVTDNLPKSLIGNPIENYLEALPGYDLYPEWVSNYGYGNVQLYRNRLVFVGARKEEKWVFRPGEEYYDKTLEETIGDLAKKNTLGKIPNHDPIDWEESWRFPLAWGKGEDPRPYHEGTKRTSRKELEEWYRDKPEGTCALYHSQRGEIKRKPGWIKLRWGSPCNVLTGGPGLIHPIRNVPLTIRERARVQGFPDDFIFYGVKVNSRGEWNPRMNSTVRHQTGKAVPLESTRYFLSEIMNHLDGATQYSSGKRIIKRNPHIDKAKRTYCEIGGYTNQEGACAECWLHDECNCRRKV